MSAPEAASQSCTVLSEPPPLAMLTAVGAVRHANDSLRQPGWDRINWPEPTSQILKVPSAMPAETNRRPSGLYATQVTMPVCPRRVRVLASQSRRR